MLLSFSNPLMVLTPHVPVFKKITQEHVVVLEILSCNCLHIPKNHQFISNLIASIFTTHMKLMDLGPMSRKENLLKIIGLMYINMISKHEVLKCDNALAITHFQFIFIC